MADQRDKTMFCECMEMNYRLNYREFSKISEIDILKFKENVSCTHAVDFVGYDPLMISLIQLSLAHFLYVKKHNISIEEIIDLKQMPFNPNCVFSSFLDRLTDNKTSFKMDSFHFISINYSRLVALDIDSINEILDEMIEHQVIKDLAFQLLISLYNDDELAVTRKIEVDVKTRMTFKSQFLLFFIFMDSPD